MPKNKGVKNQLKGRKPSGSTKTEPPEKDQPSTYKELGIDKKDASEWQRMADNEGIVLITQSFFCFFLTRVNLL